MDTKRFVIGTGVGGGTVLGIGTLVFAIAPFRDFLAYAMNADVQQRFVRSTGDGGQNVNKDATAVELRFDVRNSSLPADVKERLITLAGRHLTNAGVLVVASRASTSQATNRETADTRLLALLKRAAKPPRIRRVTLTPASVREERLTLKHRQGAVKRNRKPLSEG